MAKFEKRPEPASTALQPQLAGKPIEKSVDKTPEKAAEKVVENPTMNEPVMVETHSPEILKDLGSVVAEKDPKKDDDPITHHPTKDYEIADNSNRINGLRQFMTDQLSRALNCAMYTLDETKNWGPNPLGGPPIPVVYSREFPEIRALYDTFDTEPLPALVDLKRKLAHEHGYIYLCQWPGNTITQDRLDAQLAAERVALKNGK